MTMHDRIDKSAAVYGTFVEQVSKAIEARGISRPALSTNSGIAEERLLSILGGHPREVTLRELAGLSLALGVSVAALLAES